MGFFGAILSLSPPFLLGAERHYEIFMEVRGKVQQAGRGRPTGRMLEKGRRGAGARVVLCCAVQCKARTHGLFADGTSGTRARVVVSVDGARSDYETENGNRNYITR